MNFQQKENETKTLLKFSETEVPSEVAICYNDLEMITSLQNLINFGGFLVYKTNKVKGQIKISIPAKFLNTSTFSTKKNTS